MNTLEFLRRVLPSDGYYCGGLAYEGKFRQKLFERLEDLADFVLLASGQGGDTYYAVSTFKTATSRKRENLYHTKLFALDLDVGKPTNSYGTFAAALKAVGKYIQDANLPKPMIVSSGMGLHVYWVLTRPLEYDKWLPVATAFKEAAINAGLIIDPTVSADAARVLRPVGTTHTKSGKEVRLLMDADPVTPEIFAANFSASTVLSTQQRKTTILDNLAVRSELPPAEAGIIVNKCQQIGWAVKNQEEVPEPMWYSLMGVAAYCSEPEVAAIAWSDKHPTYSKKATLEKLEQWKANATGPATCQRFEAARPGGCKGCPFAGKVQTPVRLGARFEAVEAPTNTPDTIGQQIPIPPPFKRTVDGIKINVDDTDIDVCPFDIYPVGYGKDETLGYETVRFHWNRPHVGWTELKLRQALLTDGHRDFSAACADQGIVLYSKRQSELFQAMLRNYMEQLRKKRTLSNLYASMGWKENNSQFVLGDTVLRQVEGAVVEERSTLASSISRSGSDMFGVSGSIQSWREGTRILEVGRMPWHMFALGTGFAAPLFAFTGLKGMTISLYGPTGGGKTLIQYWIQSIYGDPDKLHFAAKFTQNALFSRLSMYGNLPMTIDEATMFQDKDVSDFLYWVSQGRDKARLTRTAEERDAKTWATPVIVSTNKSMQAKLIASGLETDAQMARLLEVSIPPNNLFSRDSVAGQKIYAHLMSNYGYAGRAFLTELVRLGNDGVSRRIDEARTNFYTKYKAKFTGEERFWEQAVILQDLGSQIASELGLIDYDYTKGTEWVLTQLGTIRKSIRENKADSFDLLAEYLNDSADSAITVMHTGAARPAVDMQRVPRGEIHVRFDVYRNLPADPFDKGTLLVHRTHFRKWLSTSGGDYKTFMADMQKEGVISTPQSGKACLGKYTSTKLAQVYVVGFNLTHPRLAVILNDVDDANLNKVI